MCEVAFIIKNEYHSLPQRRVGTTVDNNIMKLIENTCVRVDVYVYIEITMRRLRRWRSHYARVIKYDVCSFLCAVMLKRSIYIIIICIYISISLNYGFVYPRGELGYNASMKKITKTNSYNNNNKYAVLCES